MTIADKLTTIAGIKTDIRTAINGKGGSLTSGSPFSAYSAEISSLPSGGGYPPDWSEIGYTSTPQPVLDAFSYAKTINDNWDPTVTSLRGKFSGDTRLVYMPLVETSGVTNMSNMFSGCTSLTSVPTLNTSACTNMSQMLNGCSSLTSVPLFDTSSVTDMNYMFENDRRLTTLPAFNTSACTNMNGMFRYCTGLISVPQFDTSSVANMGNMFESCSGITVIPALDTRQVTNMGSMFLGCQSLQKITSLDMDKCTDFYGMLGNSWSTQSNLRFMLLKGLGTPSGVTSYANTQMNRCSNWGVADSTYTDARQSLVDSLLTYSFDRATAGYATCTIKLASNSYNQLTAQELADIQAKGYNITT